MPARPVMNFSKTTHMPSVNQSPLRRLGFTEWAKVRRPLSDTKNVLPPRRLLVQMKLHISLNSIVMNLLLLRNRETWIEYSIKSMRKVQSIEACKGKVTLHLDSSGVFGHRPRSVYFYAVRNTKRIWQRLQYVNGGGGSLICNTNRLKRFSLFIKL